MQMQKYRCNIQTNKQKTDYPKSVTTVNELTNLLSGVRFYLTGSFLRYLMTLFELQMLYSIE